MTVRAELVEVSGECPNMECEGGIILHRTCCLRFTEDDDCCGEVEMDEYECPDCNGTGKGPALLAQIGSQSHDH